MGDLQSVIVWGLLGACVLYIIYLRIQLYISQKIVKAFQASAVIVPSHVGKASSWLGFVAVALLLLASAVIASGLLR